eukprot:Gb_39367 [translate_table: standard]
MALSIATNFLFPSTSFKIRSRAKYLAIKNATVAAIVPLIETIIVPVTLPNSRPADIVKGIAGIAKISNPA